MSNQNQTVEKEVPDNNLTFDEVVTKIKGLISKSALAKLDIGLLLMKHKEVIEQHGDTEKFYEDIGINKRTAQYYKSIAGNKNVQKLRAEDKLEGLSMAKIIEKAGITPKTREIPEYEAVPVEEFKPEKCKTLRAFNAQYVLLENKVSELQKKLSEYKAEEAKAV